jgi:probable F420-dependent oxidoreductase
VLLGLPFARLSRESAWATDGLEYVACAGNDDDFFHELPAQGLVMHFAIAHPILRHPCDPVLVSADGVSAVASAAEAAGFDGFGFTDHPAPPQRWLDAGGHDALDPFAAMAFAAAHTSRLRLIPSIVVLPYRNPFLVAKSAATVDLLSGGRFTLAVGVGYLKGEFAALGVDYQQRASLFDEALDVIRQIWTNDGVCFEGRTFTAHGVSAHPRPISDPHPPIWIGGNSGAARGRVVRHGDGWCPFAAPPGLADATQTAALDTVERLGFGIDDLRRRFDAVGRDWSPVDVTFTNFVGGSPGSAAFDADTYLEGVDRLASIGVTWLQVVLPDDGLNHVLEAIDEFGRLVINAA